MSFSYDRYDRRTSSTRSSRRTTFGYWVPLILTASIATAGVVAWIWSERAEHERDDESSSDEHLDYGREQYYEGQPPPGPAGGPGGYGASQSMSAGVTGGYDDRRQYEEKIEREERGDREDDTILGRVQGALRRTPSPQQAYDIASKKVAAGVAAAGAVVGGALSSIREEDRDDFGDHERWTHEADARRTMSGALPVQKPRGISSGGRKRSVVIVVSAETTLEHLQEGDQDYRQEHASVLSHLPHVDPATTNLFVLIYAPTLASGSGGKDARSLSSSFSAISTPAQTPGEELTHLDAATHIPALSAKDFEASQVLYDRLQQEALQLVSKPTMAMPFATPTGCVHMLRHLAPDTVYLVEALSGSRGEVVEQIKGWAGQVVVVVGGDGGGLGGLVDTEDEMSGDKAEKRDEKWWENTDMIGLGKGVEVVDGVRVGEDFERRVIGRE